MAKSKKKAKKKAVARKEGFYVPLASVKVIGIGGGGGNAISRMSQNFIRGVEFIAINTDHQDLDHCDVRHKIYIGKNLTRGLGTGMNPDLGRQAAEENRSEIAESIKGADLIFIAAGLGGGTGSGGAPVVAEVAKQSGALTVAVVTRPFSFEGVQRDKIAKESLLKLREKVDAIIVVPNDRIFTVISKDTPILKAFEAIDDVLRNALKSIVELIVSPGIINLDFADVRSVVQDAGMAIIGVGIAVGADRAVKAVGAALNSPLLEISAEGAKSVLLGISGGRDLKMNEVSDAAKIVAQAADPGARIIFGAYYDRTLKANQIKITLIATGFGGGNQPTTLFSDHFDKRQSVFVNPDFNKGVKEKETGEKTYGSRAQVEDGIAKKAQTLQPEADLKKSDKNAEQSPASKEGDMWDIPTFLRRKKK